MRKVTTEILLLIFTILLVYSAEAHALVINLSCVPDPSATNYQLFSSLAGAPFVAAGTSATCVFAPTIDDTKETCFQFGASNANGSVVRTWTRICYDPTKIPPTPPATLGVK